MQFDLIIFLLVVSIQNTNPMAMYELYALFCGCHSSSQIEWVCGSYPNKFTAIDGFISIYWMGEEDVGSFFFYLTLHLILSYC